MDPLTTALGVIALLEKLEPSVQAGVMALINLWHANPQALKDILAGEVTAFDDIVAEARRQQGLPPVTPVVDPDPAAPTS